MPSAALLQEHVDRDAALVKIMHGKSAQQGNAFMSMISKDDQVHRMITDEYVRRWDVNDGAGDDSEAREKRKEQYMPLVNNYYDLATDLYEEGWAQSFHFCRFAIGEPLLKALARHEHYLSHKVGLEEGMNVLDVGCGVGGPAREIATFSGCSVVGLNNNNYQITRAKAYAEKAGLADRITFVQGDFMNINFPEDTFDAVYSIEATVHAPTLEGVYRQIFRVLKPGGTFGVYEWVMTDKYDDTDARHREIRLGIERGDGIANMPSRAEAVAAIKAAGFTLVEHEDLTARGDRVPWYYPLSGEFRNVNNLWELFGALRLTKFGRTAMRTLLKIMESVRLAPSGTAQTADELAGAADNLVAGAREGLFTPMYFMLAKKPSV
ncbi:delta(24)-sterol C-methyltransferase [Bisporella sp. PMI_857]|nr:delta(24)-sterol C-methyltransferase [Bisporella sp. PMI_857]